MSKSIPALLSRVPCLRCAVTLLAFILAGIPVSTHAEDRLAQIFRDNMVLQREKPVPVWGWSDPKTQVEVTFGDQKKQAQADDHGYWKVVLDSMPASRDGRSLDAKIGATTVSCKNVLVGEVWIAAGQSNMCAGGPDTDTGVYPHYVSPGTKGGKPEIRICSYGWGLSMDPQDDIEPKDPDKRNDGSWQLFNEDSLPDSMNIPDYFSRVVRDGLDVPVGIIRVAVPGTNQAAWMARETLEGFPGKDPSTNFYQEMLDNNNATLAKIASPFKSWDAFKQGEADWRKSGQGPWPGGGKFWLEYACFPTVLYNTRIHTLAPLAFRGVIWHQGEGGPGGPYGERLVAMVKQWRGLFGQDFDFIWGTLARSTNEPPPLVPERTQFYRSGGNVSIRHALQVFGDDKKVALVEFYDLGSDVTHFLEKAEAGRRMGLAALTLSYGQNHIYTGPQMIETKIEGGKATVRFNQVGDGLVYQPSIDGISGVYLRDKTGSPQWAQVKIIGKDTAEISSPNIANIETVAYADNSNPHETLFNSDGLPASPFTVNPPATPDPKPTIQLLTPQGEARAAFHICHVRRTGYVFQPRGKGTTPVPVQAYIPTEWKGFEVTAGGQHVDAVEADKDGVKFATFNAPVDGSWIIVAEAGKAADFQKVNRF